MKLIVIKQHTLVSASMVFLLVCISMMYSLGVNSGALDAFVNKGKEIPIYCVDTKGEKKIAISFDAAWGALQLL